MSESYYPINLKVKDRLCIIIGGGSVALRKALSLVASNGRVRIISPEVHSRLRGLVDEGKIEWVAREYRPGDLSDAFLAIAATNIKDVQHQIAVEAQSVKILVNIVDDPKGCSFQVPAVVRRGEFLLTVSTGGASPGLASSVKKELEDNYGREYEQYVSLLSKIRAIIVGDGRTQESHKKVLDKILQLDLLPLIAVGNWLAVRSELQGVLPSNIDTTNLMERLGLF